jgi:anti-sigma B factor antagonist
MKAPHAHPWLDREDIGGVTVVRVKPPQLSDDELTRAIFQQIYSLVDDFGYHHLVLDLTAVRHLGSMALGKLVMLNRKVQATQGRLALCGLTPAVAQALEITHLNQFFGIYTDDQEARQSFGE